MYFAGAAVEVEESALIVAKHHLAIIRNLNINFNLSKTYDIKELDYAVRQVNGKSNQVGLGQYKLTVSNSLGFTVAVLNKLIVQFLSVPQAEVIYLFDLERKSRSRR